MKKRGSSIRSAKVCMLSKHATEAEEEMLTVLDYDRIRQAYYNEQKGKSVAVLGWDTAKQDGTFMPAFYKTTGFIRPGDAYTGKAAPEDLPPILSAQQIEDVVAYLLTLKE